MSWLARLTVRTKLTGSFLIVALIAALIGFVGVRATGQVNKMADTMYEVELQGLHHAATANTLLMGAGRAARTALIAQTLGARKIELTILADRFRAVKKELDVLEPFFYQEEGKAVVKRARSAILAYEVEMGKVVEVLKTEAPGEAGKSTEALLVDARPLGDAAEALLVTLVDRKVQNAERFSNEIDSVYASTVRWLVVLTVLGAIIAMLLGLIITRSLTRQLGAEPSEVAAIADSISKGNLTNRIDVSRATPGSVISAMSVMQEGLRKLVASVLASSDNIATGAGQIAAGNVDLSQRTEEQAANLTETAAAMEELSSTVQSNADVAQQAAQRAAAASVAAAKGGDVVNDVVTTMAGINDSSKRIAEIIGVIDTIAFQTNILALNAAVEAARAGEQGRGFAVVASEVRSLAQKSALAAKDIKLLIDDSVAKVVVGSKLVDTAGESMQGIVAQVKQVTDLISEISAATTEQTSGLGQINDAVLQLSDVTQQNAALVEESATASSSLSEQAGKLVEIVSYFKIDENDRNAIAVPVAPPTAAAARMRLAAKAPALSARSSKAGDWEEF
ncbi:methyl-accepting chemotaxis protein [Candidimonas sp. SYP-B2681]|uniref:methyl-accepting chemotaxis protein n=1 Tax=Candidimonas sp. SYP-B2681 TaxID=2497686 RepID=UPI000F8733B6|nr:methyl-accepting chemotaxis protein [Candidimonas sp. SYP-B2681]RTZ47587.1 methyl-accepting chemotaxis protein [Candidimonas sp. SYP-B2681]